MKVLHARRPYRHNWLAPFGVFFLLLAFSISAAAQSTDIEFPTPVRGGEISGTISPRDLGDPRLTRYFYAFRGTPGDLIITAESENLEGDVDVFTAGVLRPLAKISLYAGGTRSGGSKTIYLRTVESLILRVEARTPNDSAGSFRVRFGGAFEPLGSDVPDPEPVTPTLSSETSAPKGRRVTATGARIEEPEPEPATTNSVANAPTEPATESPTSNTSPETTAEAAKPAPPKPRTPRNRRSSRNTRNRPSTTARRTPLPAEPATAPEPTVEPAAGPRLIIETKDGMRVERYMTTVRRVTVDRGQIVVVTTDGKIDRQPMSNILRMAIEP